MIKRLMAMLLVFCMMFSLVPVTALAAEDESGESVTTTTTTGESGTTTGESGTTTGDSGTTTTDDESSTTGGESATGGETATGGESSTGDENTADVTDEEEETDTTEMVKVEFTVDGASYASVEVAKGASLGDKMPADPAKEGSTFTGWTANGAAFTGETAVEADTSVSANFEIKTVAMTPPPPSNMGPSMGAPVGPANGPSMGPGQGSRGLFDETVTFDPRNEKDQATSKSYGLAELIAVPGDPVNRKEHCTFDGWYYVNTTLGELPYSTPVTYLIIKDNLIYGKWSQAYWPVTFHYPDGTKWGGNYSDDPGALTPPDPVSVPKHYKFDGWYTDSACTSGNEVTLTQDYFEGKNISDVYSKWTQNGFKVTFQYGGKSVEQWTDEGITLPSDVSDYADPHYGFDYWADENNSKVNFDAISHDIVVHPVWKQIGYKVTFHYGEESEVQWTDEGLNAPNVDSYAPEHQGFDGWKDDAGNRVDLNNITKDMDLHPIWKQVEFKITFNYGFPTYNDLFECYTGPDGKLGVNYPGIDREPAPPAGLCFAGWYTNHGALGTQVTADTLFTKDTKIYAHWGAPWEVTFYSQGEEYAKFDVAIGHSIASTGKMPKAPTRDNYKFMGWWFEGYTGWIAGWLDPQMPILENTRLDAVWNKVFKLHFDLNDTVGSTEATGGPSSMVDESKPENNTESVTFYVETKDNPTREGYTFKGWATNANATTPDYEMTDGLDKWGVNVGNVPHEETLCAVWEADTYEITFDANTGTLKNETETAVTRTATFDQVLTEIPDAEKIGHTFKEWNTSADGLGTAIDFTKPITGNWETVYAIYTVNQYEVKFDLNGAAYDKVQNVNYGGKVEKPVDPIFDPLTQNFAGWFTDPTKQTAEYKWDFENGTVTGDMTLYGHITGLPDMRSIQITFEVENGTFPAGTDPRATLKVNGSVELPKSAPNANYKWKGWEITGVKDATWEPGETITFAELEDKVTFKTGLAGSKATVTIKAVYELETYSFTAKAEPSEKGAKVDPASGSYAKGDSVTVKATAPTEEAAFGKEWAFKGWTATGITLTEEQTKATTITFEMPANEVELKAVFEEVTDPNSVPDKDDLDDLREILNGMRWTVDCISKHVNHLPLNLTTENLYTVTKVNTKEYEITVDVEKIVNEYSKAKQIKCAHEPVTDDITFKAYWGPVEAKGLARLSLSRSTEWGWSIENVDTEIDAICARYFLDFHDNTTDSVKHMPDPDPMPSLSRTFEIPEEEPTRKGYTFKGWNTQRDGKGKTYDAGDIYVLSKDDEDNTGDLYAMWKRDSSSSGKTPWWDNPRTGDTIMIAVVVMLLAGAGLAGVALYSTVSKSKKRKNR